MPCHLLLFTYPGKAVCLQGRKVSAEMGDSNTQKYRSGSSYFCACNALSVTFLRQFFLSLRSLQNSAVSLRIKNMSGILKLSPVQTTWFGTSEGSEQVSGNICELNGEWKFSPGLLVLHTDQKETILKLSLADQSSLCFILRVCSKINFDKK